MPIPRPYPPRCCSILAVLALAALAWWIVGNDDCGATRRGLARLPESERWALYDGALRTLTTTCQPGRTAVRMEAHCAEQAQFARQFSECDQACLEITAKVLHRPTR